MSGLQSSRAAVSRGSETRLALRFEHRFIWLFLYSTVSNSLAKARRPICMPRKTSHVQVYGGCYRTSTRVLHPWHPCSRGWLTHLAKEYKICIALTCSSLVPPLLSSAHLSITFHSLATHPLPITTYLIGFLRHTIPL